MKIVGSNTVRNLENWVYTETVKDHFQHPRNVLENEATYQEDGKGYVGNPKCGDMMMMVIKVDPKTERIIEAKWKTYGCASAIGSTSMLSEMITRNGGMTLAEARKISSQDIMKELGGLPDHKIHCSVLGDKALREAINDYYKRTGQTEKLDIQSSTIICQCLNVTDHDIEEAVLEGATSFEELQERTKISTACGTCKPLAQATFNAMRKKHFSHQLDGCSVI